MNKAEKKRREFKKNKENKMNEKNKKNKKSVETKYTTTRQKQNVNKTKNKTSERRGYHNIPFQSVVPRALRVRYLAPCRDRVDVFPSAASAAAA